MGGRSWTELFFLDEATALAAGHRPCFYCRRDDANRFRSCWEEGNGASNLLAKDIDAVLHRERYASGKKLHAMPSPVGRLPDGTMIAVEREAFVIIKGKPLRWTFGGYQRMETPIRDAMLLTPPSTLRALASGYRAVLHPSALAN
jgi:hypothetical protein